MNRFAKTGIVLVIFLSFGFSKIVFAAVTINSVSPSTITSADDIVTVSASASGLQSSQQYFEVAFTKDDATNYFGFTKNLKDEWYQYKFSPTTSDLSSYFYSFTPSSGSWSGQISAKLDLSDSGFKGAGNYLVRLSKFITSSASYSNTVSITVNVTLTPTPVPTDVPTNTPAPTATPTSTPTSTTSPTKSPTSTPTPISTTQTVATASPTLADDEDSTDSGVLGESTTNTEESIEENNPTQELVNANFSKGVLPYLFVASGLLFMSTCGILVYRNYFRKL